MKATAAVQKLRKIKRTGTAFLCILPCTAVIAAAGDINMKNMNTIVEIMILNSPPKGIAIIELDNSRQGNVFTIVAQIKLCNGA